MQDICNSFKLMSENPKHLPHKATCHASPEILSHWPAAAGRCFVPKQFGGSRFMEGLTGCRDVAGSVRRHRVRRANERVAGREIGAGLIGRCNKKRQWEEFMGKVRKAPGKR